MYQDHCLESESHPRCPGHPSQQGAVSGFGDVQRNQMLSSALRVLQAQMTVREFPGGVVA